MKKVFHSIINNLPYIRILYRENQNFKKNSHFPAGHFYSPIVSVEDIKNRAASIWSREKETRIPGIDLNVENQLRLLENFSSFYPEIPFNSNQQPGLRYYFDNTYYSYTDGIILYSFLRHLKPARVIEIGSGFSSANMLDTNDLFLNHSVQFTFIEPFPERLHSLLTEKDKEYSMIIEKNVQEVPSGIFRELQSGDILFIDSTHVVKTGSDVNHILFEILPSLNPGVLIHFHDVFYPFEYPEEWVLKGRNWNENYFLQAFLMYNLSYDIVLFSDFIHKHHKTAFEKMPQAYNNTGGNLWLVKK